MTPQKLCAGLIAILMATSAAQAGSLAVHTSQRTPPVGSNGTPTLSVANVVLVDFTDGSATPTLTGQQMIVHLTAGSIFQKGGGCNGGNVAPCSDDATGIPSIQYDTFVAMGGLFSDIPPSLGTALLAGGAANIPGGLPGVVMDTSQVNVAWAPPTGHFPPPANNFITAQVTLTATVQGTWSYFGSTGDGSTKTYLDRPIVNGVMLVPEPASATLLGLALMGLFGFTRSRTLTDSPKPMAAGSGRDRLSSDGP